MAFGDYPTPSSASVYLGRLHIDDCYDIRWQVEDSTAPVFDYARPHYADVVEGKMMISGSLAVVWRFPGYLTHALDDAYRAFEAPASADYVSDFFGDLRDRKNQETVQWLDKMASGTLQERFELLSDAARAGGDFLRQASALSEMAVRGGQERSQGRVEHRVPSDAIRRGAGRIQKVDIWQFYGDLDQVHLADRLVDVVLVGQSKAVSAGATSGGGISSSGSALFEVYPFFARQLIQYKMTPEGWQRQNA